VLHKTAKVASLIRIKLTKLVPKKMLRQKYLFAIYKRGIYMNSWFRFICLQYTNVEYI